MAVLVLLGGGIAGRASAACLAPGRQVVFYPTFGFQPADGGAWTIALSGRVSEEIDSVGRAALLAAFARSLEVYGQEEVEEPLLRERAASFIAEGIPGVSLRVKLDAQIFPAVGPSGPSGRFSTQVVLPVEGAGAVSQAPLVSRWAPVSLADCEEGATGRVLLIPPQGLSVLSDIDDTIKMTGVRDRRALIRNTFLKPFEAIHGMAPLYQSWAREGMVFHYVSASPEQLFPFLERFLKEAGFPDGALHLKRFGWRRKSFFSLFAAPGKYKTPLIEGILARFPKRRFVFVGDTGEADPEIYGEIARRHPAQVWRILIRRTGPRQPEEGMRYERAFVGLDSDLWQVFDQPEEIRRLR